MCADKSDEAIRDWFTYPDASDVLRIRGVIVGPQTLARYAAKFPGLTSKICDRRLLHRRTIELIVAGIPIAEIPARLRADNDDVARAHGVAASPAKRSRQPAQRGTSRARR